VVCHKVSRTFLQKKNTVKSLPRCFDGREAFDRWAVEQRKISWVHGGGREIEENRMFWWIIDLFLDRDWSDLLGVVFLIVALVVIAVLLAAN
jgi:hypothetical protein